ncbi:hypothetical protein [Candidatus Deianiraea vastatrix]|uniref:Uncharacterized protein n=1 Tax=Candidatus Deianiraea vastatrix TaxID=2163644 RepID=A0A5B8XHG5_9RICK|nr:hypothetical protein [Candidatus Deianiraea vastatrix]QED23584.1 hypothetical protein Deia_00796 [Candidatus Deianiraea vastatrix]
MIKNKHIKLKNKKIKAEKNTATTNTDRGFNVNLFDPDEIILALQNDITPDYMGFVQSDYFAQYHFLKDPIAAKSIRSYFDKAVNVFKEKYVS